MPQFPAVFELSSLNGTNGFKISGEAAGDRLGRSVASAGDINGDGFDDVIVGAYRADPNGNDSGASYVVFGRAAGFAGSIQLTDLGGPDGFKISGEMATDSIGNSVASAGDANGDGIDDLILGAPGADVNGAASGASYVVFGSTSGFVVNFQLSDINGSNGFQISGEAQFHFSGGSVASAGDINGDGFDDVVVGASGADPAGIVTGASWVVFGRANGYTAPLELSALDGATGFQINGDAAYDGSGNSVASAGDINGDGFDDLIVGSRYSDVNGYNSGASHVIFGKASGFANTLRLSSLNGIDGFQINGEAARDNSGVSVAAAGDINGDGYFDIIVGAISADSNGDISGASYVIFGKAAGYMANLELSSLNGANGFQIGGEVQNDRSGGSVASAGDFNGDGFDDVIVGANGAPNGSGFGASYVVFGKASGFLSTLPLSMLDGNSGFQINGEATGDLSGRSVASAGDVNGDGFDDVIIGAHFADPNGSESGASYVIFGHRPKAAINFVGSNLAQTTNGSDFADTFSGNGGNDRILGYAGGDLIDGGAGNDVMIGGTGNDTYVVERAADVVTEAANAGLDTIRSIISRSLNTSANVENLVLDGAAAISGTGNMLLNRITGNGAANLLDGGSDTLVDVLSGLGGNDIYQLANRNDQVVEGLNAGIDTIRSTISRSLASVANVERLVLDGTAAINGNGNALGNLIIGNAAANILNGSTGNDTLTGGAGSDVFVFNTVLNATANRDTITDFSNVGQNDVMNLENTGSGRFTTLTNGMLNAAFFKANATGTATDANDRIIYNTTTGALFYDSNGNAAGGALQFATLTTKPNLTAADFFVI